jgi:hypothetical protein
MKNFIWVSVLILLLVAAVTGGCNKASEGFAIYLTHDNIPVSQMASLSHYELSDNPVISLNDIVSYAKDTHEIELTPDAYQYVMAMKVPTSGQAFVVCVDKKQLYWGAFWMPFSSQSFDGVTILFPGLLKGNIIQLSLGYPSASFFRGEDPRANLEIFQSLEKAGKLK